MDLKAFNEKGVDVYFVPTGERARWEKQVEPYIEKQFTGVGEFGQKIKKIAKEANKAHSYTPGKGF